LNQQPFSAFRRDHPQKLFFLTRENLRQEEKKKKINKAKT
jgi:hypothetical protein